VQIFHDLSHSRITPQIILKILAIQVRPHEREANLDITSTQMRSRSATHLPYYDVTNVFHLELTLVLSQHEVLTCSHSMKHHIFATQYLISDYFD